VLGCVTEDSTVILNESVLHAKMCGDLSVVQVNYTHYTHYQLCITYLLTMYQICITFVLKPPLMLQICIKPTLLPTIYCLLPTAYCLLSICTRSPRRRSRCTSLGPKNLSSSTLVCGMLKHSYTTHITPTYIPPTYIPPIYITYLYNPYLYYI
jgi:hypothetical protein